MSARSVLVALPTYEEADNLRGIVTAVLAAEPRADVLVVDDASPDGTGAIAEALSSEHPGRVHVLHRAGKLGLGTAYLAAFRWALARSYAEICEMDADFSHAPEVLPRLVDAVRSGADVALGSRWIPGGGTRNWGLARRLISRGGSLYARAWLGVDVRDLTGGFKCFARRVLEGVALDEVRTEGYSFQIELTYRALRRGFRVVELPIVFVDRRAGRSKLSRRTVLEALWTVPALRLLAPREVAAS